MKNIIPLFVIMFISSCNNNSTQKKRADLTATNNSNQLVTNIAQVPLPTGYKRISADKNSFAEWLRKLSFKKSKEVYLFNGQLKPNQKAQYAVIDITTGNKDLQQCADVVMRLRAAYLFAERKFGDIWFTDFEGKKYAWKGGGDKSKFTAYLENVFGWCGSASLEKQLNPVSPFSAMQIGDVLIKGGFPGHAVMVVDMAANNNGEKIFMLVQGYQPAQDMHILLNPTDEILSPWYKLSNDEHIYTPEWHFTTSQLRRWQTGN